MKINSILRLLRRPGVRGAGFVGGVLSCGYIVSQLPVLRSAVMDIKSARTEISRRLHSLRSQPESKEMLQPEVILSSNGSSSSATFEIDQRQVDVFPAVVELIQLTRNADNLALTEAFRSGKVCSIKLAFGEVSRRGYIHIVGEFSESAPAFKFVMERPGQFDEKDLDLLMQMYKACNRVNRKPFQSSQSQFATSGKKNSGDGAVSAAEELRNLGVLVFHPEDSAFASRSWDDLGGYHSQKRQVEDTIFLSLQHPEIHDSIVRETRRTFEQSRPKAVLFEGPPGTGKTTMAKIIASQSKIPMLYLPLEAVLSKWFGESERNLALIFEAAQKMGKVILFVDEIDALAMDRSGDIHEVSRKLVSTLLRKLDSFESSHQIILICATNRKDSLDPALLSRLDLSIKFDHPSDQERREIYQRYAKQFLPAELEQLSEASRGASGRAILESCRDVERTWASKMVRKEVDSSVPTLDLYLHAIQARINLKLN